MKQIIKRICSGLISLIIFSSMCVFHYYGLTQISFIIVVIFSFPMYICAFYSISGDL